MIFQHINLWVPILILLAVVGGLIWGEYMWRKDNRE